MRGATGLAGAWVAIGCLIAGCSGDDTLGFAPDAAALLPHDASIPDDDASDATTAWDAGDAGDAGDASDASDAAAPDASRDAAADASVPLEGAVALAGTSTTIAGSTSFCALLGDGSVRCWGNDGYGQSGTGAPESPFVTTLPAEPVGLSFGVALVAVGDTFAGAVQQGATLLWGDDSAGELGNGVVAPSYTPRVVAGLGGATALALGGEAGCAVIAGAVKCWGANTFGNVGNGATTVQSTPTAIGVAASKVVVSQHACALTASGGVSCWGRNDFGQLGRTTTKRCTGASTPCDPTPALSFLTSGATELAVGSDFTCAIAPSTKADAGAAAAAVAQCWGDDDDAQLGGGSSDAGAHAGPVIVSGLSAAPVKLAAGGAFACALVAGGAVQCWGANDHGQLGASSGAPGPVTAVTGATSIAVGEATACAIVDGGTVECWGANDQGQLGIGTVDAQEHGPTVVLAR